EVPVIDAGTQAVARALEEVRRPFDLTAGPLLRACVISVGPQRHLCVLAIHHLVTDGWSIALLARELSFLYAEAAAGRAVRLAGGAPQSADVAWPPAPGRLPARLDAWRDALAGLRELSSLPADFPRPALRDGKGALLRFRFPRTLSDR